MCYIFENTPNLFQICSVRPLYVIPFIIILSSFEKNLVVLSNTLLGGFLLDFSSTKFWGYYLIISFICSFITCLIIRYCIKRNMFTILLIISVFFVLICCVDFLFYKTIYRQITLSFFLVQWVYMYIYTLVISAIIYLLTKFIYNCKFF